MLVLRFEVLLDRLNPLYSGDYNFRDIYMIATAADDSNTTFDKAYSGLQGWVDCFDKATLKGKVVAGGVDDAGSIDDFIDIKNKAYELGRGL